MEFTSSSAPTCSILYEEHVPSAIPKIYTDLIPIIEDVFSSVIMEDVRKSRHTQVRNIRFTWLRTKLKKLLPR